MDSQDNAGVNLPPAVGKQLSKIRSFMRVVYPTIIDILFVISVIAVFIWALILAVGAGRFGDFGMALLAFFGTCIGGLIGVILTFGMIYVMLDIRDSLQGK